MTKSSYKRETGMVTFLLSVLKILLSFETLLFWRLHLAPLHTGTLTGGSIICSTSLPFPPLSPNPSLVVFKLGKDICSFQIFSLQLQHSHFFPFISSSDRFLNKLKSQFKFKFKLMAKLSRKSNQIKLIAIFRLCTSIQ